jgi:DNA-binding response OmpR family regulator
MRILLVEDSARLRELLRELVTEAGYHLDDVTSLDEAHAALRAASHDAMILDLGLPDGDGLALVRELRRNGSALPVLVLTARGSVEDRVAGLNAGADDYLTKPFHNDELLARLRALLRRPAAVQAEILTSGAFALDSVQRIVTCSGVPLTLTPREHELFELLFRQWGQVVVFERIENTLSEFGHGLEKNTIEVLVSRLRKKLAQTRGDIDLITVRGIGYMLKQTP